MLNKAQKDSVFKCAHQELGVIQLTANVSPLRCPARPPPPPLPHSPTPPPTSACPPAPPPPMHKIIPAHVNSHVLQELPLRV